MRAPPKGSGRLARPLPAVLLLVLPVLSRRTSQAQAHSAAAAAESAVESVGGGACGTPRTEPAAEGRTASLSARLGPLLEPLERAGLSCENGRKPRIFGGPLRRGSGATAR